MAHRVHTAGMRRLPPTLVALPLLSLFVCFAACTTETIIHQSAPPTDTPTEDPDAGDLPDTSTPDTFVPDAAPPKGTTFPHVESRGGKTIASPKVVPIVFAGDPMASQITSFTQNIATSQFWKTQAAEYGVGPITAKSTITLTEAAPTSITFMGIDTWLANKLAGGSLGTPDGSTLYSIYFPASTTIVDDGEGLGQSCQGYGGYHYETTVGSLKVGYAVLPRCSDIDELTVAASHEYFEWATDPFPNTTPAFNKLDDDHWAWGQTMLGELGDLCTFLDTDNLRPTEVGFEIQRMWSNKASLAGTYPCAPVGTRPYVTAITTATDEAQVPDQDGTLLTTKDINIPPGTSRTVDVFIYSDKSSSVQVPLRALSYADFAQTGKQSGYTYKLSKQFAAPGETIQVTITAPSQQGSDILVMMTQTSDQTALFWPVLVANQPTALRAPSPIKSPITMRPRSNIRASKLGMPKAALKLPF